MTCSRRETTASDLLDQLKPLIEWSGWVTVSACTIFTWYFWIFCSSHRKVPGKILRTLLTQEQSGTMNNVLNWNAVTLFARSNGHVTSACVRDQRYSPYNYPIFDELNRRYVYQDPPLTWPRLLLRRKDVVCWWHCCRHYCPARRLHWPWKLPFLDALSSMRTTPISVPATLALQCTPPSSAPLRTFA